MIKIKIETDSPNELGNITGVLMKHYGKLGENREIEVPVTGHKSDNKFEIEIIIKNAEPEQ